MRRCWNGLPPANGSPRAPPLNRVSAEITTRFFISPSLRCLMKKGCNTPILRATHGGHPESGAKATYPPIPMANPPLHALSTRPSIFSPALYLLLISLHTSCILCVEVAELSRSTSVYVISTKTNQCDKSRTYTHTLSLSHACIHTHT